MLTEPRTPTETDQEAKERVEGRLCFLTHLTYFVALNLLFMVLNYIAAGSVSWSLYIAGIWGVFLYLHFMGAFVVADLRGPFRRWLIRREHEKTADPPARERRDRR